MSGRGAGGNSDLYGPGKSLGRIGRAEESVDSGGGVKVGDTLLLEELPDERVVNLPETDMCASHRTDRPGECPADGVEAEKERMLVFCCPVMRAWNTGYVQRKSPEVPAPAGVNVQVRLDHVGKGGEIGTSVGVHDTLGAGGCSRGEGERDQIIFGGALSLETLPSLLAKGVVVLKTLPDSLVEGTV